MTPTAPLTQPEMDLRGLAWMPLHVQRLLDSDFFALSTGEEFKAALALWCKSWQQVPAASLPADERILAHLSGAGERWPHVRDMALRGWVTCDDGRLYHPVVAQQAFEAAEWRAEHLGRKAAATERKQRERAERAAMFAALRVDGKQVAWNAPTSELRALCERLNLTPVTDPSRVTGGDASHIASRLRQDRTGQDLKAKAEANSVAPDACAVAEGPPARETDAGHAAAAAGEIWQALEAEGVPFGFLSRRRHAGRIAGWVQQGVTLDQVHEAVARAAEARRKSGDTGPLNPGFIDCHLQDVLTGTPAQGRPRSRGFADADELSRRFAAGEG